MDTDTPAHRIDGIDVFVDGGRGPALLMVHGWPDTARLWDRQVAALKRRFRCVRFTLPGFDAAGPRRAVSLDETLALIGAIADAVSPRRPVVLLLHDWGCVFGYAYARRRPERVDRIVGVDIGDAGSSAHRRSLSLAAMAAIAAYQGWLATAWRIGGKVGDGMTRSMARIAGAPADPERVHAGMDYPYDILWTRSHGSYRDLAPLDRPPCPMLFVYGRRKPFLFHSPAWADALAAQPGCRVVGLDTGHWVMSDAPDAFNAAVEGWLSERAAV